MSERGRRARRGTRAELPASARQGRSCCLPWAVVTCVAVGIAGAPRLAAAHPGRPIEPHDLWTAWNPDPWVLLVVGLAIWLYARGAGAVWRRAGAGSGIRRWRFACFAAGAAVLLLALISPLDALGGALFSAHMVQHELLMLVAAPLMVLGTPLIAWIWALPRGTRGRIGRFARAAPVRSAWMAISRPVTAWILSAVAIWIWHIPALYQSTLTSESAHVAQHLTFFATAVLFWWPVLSPTAARLRAGLGVIYLFGTALHGSALGALLTFTTEPWYPLYADRVRPWGLTPLEDQQLGGLIMWIPFGTIYTLAALVLFGLWLTRLEARSPAAPSLLTSPVSTDSRAAQRLLPPRESTNPPAARSEPRPSA